MRLKVLTFFFFASLYEFVYSVDNGELRLFDNGVVAFDNGVVAFDNEVWDECVTSFEGALRGFEKSKDMLVACHRRCDEEVALLTSTMAENLENLHNLEKFVRRSLCLSACGSDLTSFSFDKWKAYEYLQHCYFQNNQIQNAASAAYTVLASNPDHEGMTAMLKFYTMQPGVIIENIRNLEASPFTSIYRNGLVAYKNKDFVQVIESMEKSLDLLMEEEDVCRAECANDVPEIMEWLPEFSSPVISEIASELKCKRLCGEQEKNLPSNILKYLHYAYFQVGNHTLACEALATFLLFHPNDGKMAHVKTHYQDLAQVPVEGCLPRKVISQYVSRQNYEEQLFKEIQKRSWNENRAENKVKMGSPISNELGEDHSIHRRSISVGDDLNAFDDTVAVNAIRESFMKNTRLLKSGAELNGDTRFLAQGLASEDECKMLVQLAKAVVPMGHGFVRDNPTPFSGREKFQMLEFERAELMAYFGTVKQKMVDTLFEITDRSKLYLEKHFNLQGKLTLEATNLNCKTPLDDAKPENGHELSLSQRFHADNCLEQEDGVTCIKNEKDMWRDFSSVVYLNDDFEGGELVFSRNFSIDGAQAVVVPRCGHNVGFSSGTENIHGIRGVANGPRCALVSFYTLTPERNCRRRVRAQMFWDRARLGGSISDEAVRRLDHDRDFS